MAYARVTGACYTAVVRDVHSCVQPVALPAKHPIPPPRRLRMTSLARVPILNKHGITSARGEIKPRNGPPLAPGEDVYAHAAASSCQLLASGERDMRRASRSAEAPLPRHAPGRPRSLCRMCVAPRHAIARTRAADAVDDAPSAESHLARHSPRRARPLLPAHALVWRTTRARREPFAQRLSRFLRSSMRCCLQAKPAALPSSYGRRIAPSDPQTPEALNAELCELAALKPTPDRRARVEALLGHKWEGVQTVAAQVLATWGGLESVAALRAWLAELTSARTPGRRVVSPRKPSPHA